MTSEAEMSKLTPVYVPYATLMSALETLRTHGIPSSGMLDKSIWDSQSGAIRAQLILGLKFLKLIDENRRVLPALPPLVEAQGEQRKLLLKSVIENAYSDVIALGLATISPGQLDEAFKKYAISGSTLARSTRFFIKACAELGIPISKRFSDRTRVAGPRKKRVSNGSTKTKDESPKTEDPGRGQDGQSNAMKTIALPKVDGVLSISGSFNPFLLMGDERKLVYDIIDLMTAFENKAGKAE